MLPVDIENRKEQAEMRCLGEGGKNLVAAGVFRNMEVSKRVFGRKSEETVKLGQKQEPVSEGGEKRGKTITRDQLKSFQVTWRSSSGSDGERTLRAVPTEVGRVIPNESYKRISENK